MTGTAICLYYSYLLLYQFLAYKAVLLYHIYLRNDCPYLHPPPPVFPVYVEGYAYYTGKLLEKKLETGEKSSLKTEACIPHTAQYVCIGYKMLAIRCRTCPLAIVPFWMSSFIDKTILLLHCHMAAGDHQFCVRLWNIVSEVVKMLQLLFSLLPIFWITEAMFNFFHCFIPMISPTASSVWASVCAFLEIMSTCWAFAQPCSTLFCSHVFRVAAIRCRHVPLWQQSCK